MNTDVTLVTPLGWGLWAVAMLLMILELVVVALVAPSAVYGQTRTPPEATAHALDELANGLAQGKITLTPTPSPTATTTPTPVPSSTPVPTETATPVPTETPVPEVCWLMDDVGGVVFDEEGHPVPCAVAQDLVAEEPTPAPSISPTATPQSPTAPTPIVQRVVEYVTLPTPEPQVIYVTRAEPTVQALAPTATREPVATRAPVPTRTPTLTSTPLPTATPTSTAIAIAVAARTDQAAPNGRWDWLLFAELFGAVLVVIAVVIVFITRRRVAVWKGQSDAA